jgi:tripartite-type tricarboxylate transporter receptor subunit TctC
MTSRRQFVLAGAAAALAATGPAQAQSAGPAPGKVVRFMNGFPPGGSADTVTRLIAERLRGTYAANVIVENRPGGGGRTVLEQARSLDADGSVVVLTPTAMLTIFPHVYRNLGYDTFRDFTAVGSAATFVTAVSAGPALPASVKTLQEYIAWAKQNPAVANYGSPGAGTSLHFVGTMLARQGGVALNHVPYKGAAPMMQDLLGGQIPIGMAPIGDAVPQARAGKLRVLATTGPQRSPFLPDVPTARESGFPDIVAEDFFAFFVPSKTPADVVDRLGAALREALRAPEVKERMGQLGLDLRSTTPAEMQAIVRAQFDSWGPIVKASGFTADE